MTLPLGHQKFNFRCATLM